MNPPKTLSLAEMRNRKRPIKGQSQRAKKPSSNAQQWRYEDDPANYNEQYDADDEGEGEGDDWESSPSKSEAAVSAEDSSQASSESNDREHTQESTEPLGSPAAGRVVVEGEAKDGDDDDDDDGEEDREGGENGTEFDNDGGIHERSVKRRKLNQ
ncbi:MAG: hypothetical protein Q9202_001273 [Teloschistes flavicans]